MNHRLSPASRKSRKDSVDFEHKCAARIISFWQARGFSVEIEIETGGFSDVLRAPVLSLRSDMVNGFPTREQIK